jgi:hypothetical protein
MNLNDIPESKVDNFPIGVSEREFSTAAEMFAFQDGISYSDEMQIGEPFRRGQKIVVRIFDTNNDAWLHE